jgi:hypothetical protein
VWETPAVWLRTVGMHPQAAPEVLPVPRAIALVAIRVCVMPWTPSSDAYEQRDRARRSRCAQPPLAGTTVSSIAQAHYDERPRLFEPSNDGAMPILPKVRDARLITVRRGGSLTDEDHRLLAEWAAVCAEHVLHLFEREQPSDARPRQAITTARYWIRGDVHMKDAHRAAFAANAAARGLGEPAKFAALAAGGRGCARRGSRPRRSCLRDPSGTSCQSFRPS